MKGSRQHSIAIKEIELTERHRPLGDIEELKKSIDRIGLINPLTVTDSIRLVAGYHRLEAVKALGWDRVECIITSVDDLDAELAEIDENLMRYELSVNQKSQHLNRRNEILDGLGERAKVGDNRHTRPATVAGLPKTTKDVAKDAGISERTARNYSNIGKNLKPATAEIVESCPKLANSTGKLQQLARITDEAGQVEQARIMVEEINKPKPKPKQKPKKETPAWIECPCCNGTGTVERKRAENIKVLEDEIERLKRELAALKNVEKEVV